MGVMVINTGYVMILYEALTTILKRHLIYIFIGYNF